MAFPFNKLPTPSFIYYPSDNVKKQNKTNILDVISEEIKYNTHEPASEDLLAWIRFYLHKDVIGVESNHTARSKIYDLYKFVAFYHNKLSSFNIELWGKSVTQQFVDNLELTYKQSTVYRIFATVCNFASFLVLHNAISAKDNPTKNIRLVNKDELPEARGLQVVDEMYKQVKYSGEQIYQLMIKVARERISNPLMPRARPCRDAAILTVLYGTGIRVSELCSLRYDQLREASSNKGIWFDNVKCKGKGTRKVYLQSKYVPDLLAYTDNSNERNKKIPWLFQSYRGRQLTQPTVYNILVGLAKETQEKYLPNGYKIMVSPHSLRHERGYNLKKTNKGDSFIQKGLGHKDSRQVIRYTRQSERAEEAEYEEV